MGGIELERAGDGVAWVWLTNPGRLNALADTMVIGLCDAFAGLASDNDVRAVVVRGRGGVFCAGRDLADLAALQHKGADEIARMYGFMQRMNEAVADCPHPTIAVVERYALGIGTMIASWCDIVLAASDAQFGYPEVRHGITPYGAVPTMLQTLTRKAMLDLLFTGRRILADEAARAGIVTRAVPADALDAELERLLDDLRAGSAAAIRRSKAFLRDCEGLTHRQRLEEATRRHIAGIGAAEMKSGLEAFLDRRGAPGT